MEIIHSPQAHQVLQRIGHQGANTSLSGKATPFSEITLSIRDSSGQLPDFKTIRLRADATGSFLAELRQIPIGGPYELRIEQGNRSKCIGPFFVGDVWILAGQSNMEGLGNMTHAAEPHPLVQAYSMARVWRPAEDPLHILQESTDACHSKGQACTAEQAESLRANKPTGVGAGVFFGREMVERTGVPQGLICAAHGGTSMESWSTIRAKAEMYHSMLKSVRQTGQPVAGVLWYQGESDAAPGNIDLYAERMQQLVASTREELQQPELPWIMVQIGKVFGHKTKDSIRHWNQIQEQQRQLPETITDLYTIAAIDLPMDDGIHISATGFPTLAQRMAVVAEALQSGENSAAQPPKFEAIRKLDNGSKAWRFAIRYSNVGYLKATGTPHGFALTDSAGDEQPLIIKTTLEEKEAIIEVIPPMGKLPEDFNLSYGHGCTPYCNLSDARGMALPVFGPIPLAPKSAGTPYLRHWKVSAPQELTRTGKEIPAPPEGLPLSEKSYGEDGFINEHDNWAGQSGYAYFFQKMSLSEPMTLSFKMGYDGPFAAWIDESPLHADPYGSNPCLPDKTSRTIQLSAGEHEICTGMDVGNGIAWGFFLRVIREDLSKETIDSGEFALPGFAEF
ncbi:sialate O-acetylesterase [Coraliomargarita parva]|uniref:sialate O-acetylesterase n=1 Tax=Coraliomargarita parva TaxID=3014050 RepID=UPI0022B3D245|nr:sialate O-acetylesterase [Coraliomargarita parva]